MQPSEFYLQPDPDFLLESIPIVVPFWDNSDGLGLRHVVQSVAMYLNSQLFHILSFECKGLGGYTNHWFIFHLEVAIEELFTAGLCALHLGDILCPWVSVQPTRIV